MADINLTTGLDNSDFNKGLKDMINSLSTLNQQVQMQNASMSNAFDSLKSKGWRR